MKLHVGGPTASLNAALTSSKYSNNYYLTITSIMTKRKLETSASHKSRSKQNEIIFSPYLSNINAISTTKVQRFEMVYRQHIYIHAQIKTLLHEPGSGEPSSISTKLARHKFLRGCCRPPSMHTPTPLEPATVHQPQPGATRHSAQLRCMLHDARHCALGPASTTPHSPFEHRIGKYGVDIHWNIPTRFFYQYSSVTE